MVGSAGGRKVLTFIAPRRNAAGVITVVADTHGTDGHRLAAAALDAVQEADVVLHAGDFTTESVLDAFAAEAATLAAVHGNNDVDGVRHRLPAERVLDHQGARVAVVHGHEHSPTTLPLFAREAGADLVVVGHSHRPGVERVDGVAVLNPGSHADPRRYRPGFATLRVAEGELTARIQKPDGTPIDSCVVETGHEKTGR